MKILHPSSRKFLSSTEAVDDFPISSGSNTSATKPDVSFVEDAILVKDFPRTRANPEVSSDKKSNMKNLKDVFSPSTIQDIDVSLLSEEDTPKTKENPESLSDKESEKDVSKDTITESNYKLPAASFFAQTWEQCNSTKYWSKAYSSLKMT